MNKIAILYSKYVPTIDAIKHRLSDYIIDCLKEPKQDMSEYNLVISFDTKYKGKALICHHSLLPAFDTDEPVKEAFLSGVKVTGITILYTNPSKIIAQYPIFISCDKHYEDIETELNYIEMSLLPIVAEKILKNESIEISSIINNKSKNDSKCICGGCRGCTH